MNAVTEGGPESHNLMEKNTKSRIVWIDMMRGFLMFWVIFGHITEDPEQINYIYSFHMPAYFFLTGMTFRYGRQKTVPEFILGKFFALMAPYFVLNVYAAPFREWLEIVGEANSQSFVDLLIGIAWSNADSGYKMASNTLWFIPCLFLSVVIFYLITRLCRNRELPIVLLTLGMTVAAWAVNMDTEGGGPSHWRGAVFSVLFVMAGHIFSSHMESLQNKILGHRWLAAVGAALLLVAGWQVSLENGYVSIIHNEYKSLILFYTSALLTTVALSVLMMLLTESETAVRLLAPVDFIGQKTLPYIAFQVPFMKLMWYYMPETFGTKAMPWLLIQTVFLFFAMMPFAWAVDKAVPRKMPKVFTRKGREERAALS